MNPALMTSYGAHWMSVGPHSEHVRRACGWIATACDLYCDFAATARPVVVTRHGPSEHETTPLAWGSTLQRLLRRPCGDRVTRDLWQRIVLRYWLTTGNVYLYRQHASDRTLALWPVSTQSVTPVRDKRTGLIGSLQIQGHSEEFSYSQFVHLRRPNVVDPYGEGLSPISEHAITVELSDTVDQLRLQTFSSPRRPNMIFSSDLPLSDEDVTRNEARVMAKWGTAAGTGRPLFLDSGMRLLGPAMLTPAEIDYLQTTRVTREEVLCGIYRIPQLLAGFSEPGQPPSEGLIAGAATLFARTAVDPLIHAIYSQLVDALAADPNVEVTSASTAPINRNQQRADEAVDRRECVRSVNEIREARGLPPIGQAWASDQQWRPDLATRSYHADPAPNAQPSDRGNTPPGPKPSDADKLSDPAAGDAGTAG